MFNELDDMVDQDLAARGIDDERVLNAFRKVDRRRFVLDIDRERAYADRALPLTHGQTVSQPFMVAIMLQELKLTGTEKVLEIGTGSGYQTALLAELCREVWSVERIEYLATTAEDRLDAMGYKNIKYRLGDGSLGWPEAAPYERIVVAAACLKVPAPLEEQLGEGGLIVLPVGGPEGQTLTIGTKQEDKIAYQTTTDCIFVPLIGANGFPAYTPRANDGER